MPSPNLLALTTVTAKLLASMQVPTAAATTVYAVPANHSTKLAQGTLTNVSGGAVTVGVAIVPSGGTDDGTHSVLPAGFSLAAGDSVSLDAYIGGHFLGDGDFISVHPNTAAAIDVVISGVELS